MSEDRPPLSVVGPRELTPATGWRLQRLGGPSDLFGANGIQLGPDGRLYVAQAFGAQVSAINLATGQIAHMLTGDPIVAPDDLDFRADGTAYITDVATSTTWAWRPGGAPEPYAVDQPANNGVTVRADGRIFIDEFRPGGRLLEGPGEAGRPSRVILEGLNGPNALDAGPDGRLFFPQVFAGEIWSVDPDSGATRRIVGGLGSPTAVKVAPDGSLVVPLSAEGVVVRVDPRSGAVATLAETPPGIDNVAVDGAGRLFVSHYVDGRVAEVPAGVAAGQRPERILNPPGFVGPFDVAERPGGTLIVADGLSIAYVEGDVVTRAGRLLTADSPGLVGAVHTTPDGRTYVAGRNAVWQYTPAGARRIRDDFRNVTGLAMEEAGTLLVADHDAGEVHRIHPDDGAGDPLVRDVSHPTRLAVAPDGALYISDAEAGRVAVHRDGVTHTLTETFERPEGIAADADRVYVVDAAQRALLACARTDGSAELIIDGLPVGAPPGVRRLVSGSGLWLSADGALIVAADGDGSLLRLSRETS